MNIREWIFKITEETHRKYNGKSINDFINNELPDAKAIELNSYGIIGGYYTEKNGKHYAVVTTFDSCD